MYSWNFDNIKTAQDCSAGRIHLSSTMFLTILGICWCLIGQGVETLIQVWWKEEGEDGDEEREKRGSSFGRFYDPIEREDDELLKEEYMSGFDGSQGSEHQHSDDKTTSTSSSSSSSSLPVACSNNIATSEKSEDHLSFSGLAIHNTQLSDALPSRKPALTHDETKKEDDFRSIQR